MKKFWYPDGRWPNHFKKNISFHFIASFTNFAVSRIMLVFWGNFEGNGWFYLIIFKSNFVCHENAYPKVFRCSIRFSERSQHVSIIFGLKIENDLTLLTSYNLLGVNQLQFRFHLQLFAWRYWRLTGITPLFARLIVQG